jgi:hypothetical protein
MPILECQVTTQYQILSGNPVLVTHLADSWWLCRAVWMSTVDYFNRWDTSTAQQSKPQHSTVRRRRFPLRICMPLSSTAWHSTAQCGAGCSHIACIPLSTTALQDYTDCFKSYGLTTPASLRSTAQRSTAQRSAAQRSTAQHSTAQQVMMQLPLSRSIVVVYVF